jgi:hypothetical protein
MTENENLAVEREILEATRAFESERSQGGFVSWVLVNSKTSRTTHGVQDFRWRCERLREKGLLEVKGLPGVETEFVLKLTPKGRERLSMSEDEYRAAFERVIHNTINVHGDVGNLAQSFGAHSPVAQSQNEAPTRPILAVRVEPAQSRYSRSRSNERSHLVLRNEGAGPAFNVCVEPYSVEGRTLEFDHGSSSIYPGEDRELTFHLEEGNSGTVGNVDELYYWINTGKLPDPLILTLRCRSITSTDYTIMFRLTPKAGRLEILLGAS